MSQLPNDTSQPDGPQTDAPKPRRVSRYQKSLQRREAQKRSDNKFYAGMATVMGATVMIALLAAALSVNGTAVDTGGMSGWSQPWLGPLTKLEAAGLALVALIATGMYLRMRKR